jgi:hypothetical protein
MSDTEAKVGHLPTALATYLFLLHQAGHAAQDSDTAAAVEALATAEDSDAAGQILVDLIAGKLDGADDPDPTQVAALMATFFGGDHVATDLGEERWDRARNARRYHFKHNLPWLARIVDRFPSGLGTHWVLVERVTDEVTCMDPYPWDDLDEEYSVPVLEFMVKWELAGGESVRFV